MQNNFGLKITVIVLFSILLFLVIIGPELSESILAANDEKILNPVETLVADNRSEPLTYIISEGGITYSAICEMTTPKVDFDLKYNDYPITNTYILIENPWVNIRSAFSTNGTIIKAAPRNEKFNYLETVINDVPWYHVAWQENGQTMSGYISADAATKRVFQFDKMHEAVQKAEKESREGNLTYINNYRNRNGYAPSYKGGDYDRNGNSRSQSAPGYLNTADTHEFIYLGDGAIVRILSKGNEQTEVVWLNDGKSYYVPNKYLADSHAITGVRKAIVVDRANQNEAVFEKIGEEWKVISYSLATTGAKGNYKAPTPLGYFYGIEKKPRFYYYKDGTTIIQGYAPYAVRFTGGAYIHGVPVNSKYTAAGARIDSKMVEYSRTIGTVPLSHKCVRNYTSHAKFIYDWYSPGETIIIVIE